MTLVIPSSVFVTDFMSSTHCFAFEFIFCNQYNMNYELKKKKYEFDIYYLRLLNSILLAILKKIIFIS